MQQAYHDLTVIIMKYFHHYTECPHKHGCRYKYLHPTKESRNKHIRSQTTTYLHLMKHTYSKAGSKGGICHSTQINKRRETQYSIKRMEQYECNHIDCETYSYSKGNSANVFNKILETML